MRLCYAVNAGKDGKIELLFRGDAIFFCLKLEGLVGWNSLVGCGLDNGLRRSECRQTSSCPMDFSSLLLLSALLRVWGTIHKLLLALVLMKDKFDSCCRVYRPTPDFPVILGFFLWVHLALRGTGTVPGRLNRTDVIGFWELRFRMIVVFETIG